MIIAANLKMGQQCAVLYAVILKCKQVQNYTWESNSKALTKKMKTYLLHYKAGESEFIRTDERFNESWCPNIDL